jgi:hypothetical protein
MLKDSNFGEEEGWALEVIFDNIIEIKQLYHLELLNNNNCDNRIRLICSSVNYLMSKTIKSEFTCVIP